MCRWSRGDWNPSLDPVLKPLPSDEDKILHSNVCQTCLLKESACLWLEDVKSNQIYHSPIAFYRTTCSSSSFVRAVKENIGPYCATRKRPFCSAAASEISSTHQRHSVHLPPEIHRGTSHPCTCLERADQLSPCCLAGLLRGAATKRQDRDQLHSSVSSAENGIVMPADHS